MYIGHFESEVHSRPGQIYFTITTHKHSSMYVNYQYDSIIDFYRLENICLYTDITIRTWSVVFRLNCVVASANILNAKRYAFK